MRVIRKYLNKYDIIILLVLIVSIFFTFKNAIDRLGELNKTEISLKKELLLKQKQNKELKQRVKISQSDYFVEQVARAKLGYVKSGERLYKLVNN